MRLAKAGEGEPQNRRRVLTVIAANPGVSFRVLARLCGMPSGTVRYHLEVLLRQERVWSVRYEVRLLHFAGARPPSPAAVAQAVRGTLDELDQRILVHVAQSPGLPQKSLLALGLALRSTMQNRLARLARRGFLAMHPQGRLRTYCLAGMPMAVRHDGEPPSGACMALDDGAPTPEVEA